MRWRWPLVVCLLLSSLPAHAVNHASVRLQLLTYHFQDVSDEAHAYPHKLDPAGHWVFTPGLTLAWDQGLPVRWLGGVRTLVTLYEDCVGLPSAYVAVFPLAPDVVGERVSFGGGFGVGAAVRRNWAETVLPGHQSDSFHPAGPVEWQVSPYGEAELRLHEADRRIEALLDILPGFPFVAVLSVGTRVVVP